MMKAARSGQRHNARVRCAIYTRKSTEEGLDQEFNTLQAQREACEAFINSQRVALAIGARAGGITRAVLSAESFHGEPRRNDTHVSTTDPETRLFRKGLGKEARLCFMGHALMENRNGLIVGAVTTTATGHAERWAAVRLIEPHAATPQPVTLGADKGYDSADFVRALRDKAVTPHVAAHQWPPLGDRRGHRRSSRLCNLAAHPQTRRGGLRLGQDRSRVAQDASSRTAQSRLAIHPRHGRL